MQAIQNSIQMFRNIGVLSQQRLVITNSIQQSKQTRLRQHAAATRKCHVIYPKQLHVHVVLQVGETAGSGHIAQLSVSNE